jgi:hypothetical protein
LSGKLKRARHQLAEGEVEYSDHHNGNRQRADTESFLRPKTVTVPIQSHNQSGISSITVMDLVGQR